MSADASGPSEPLRILYGGRQQGTVAHLVVAPSGQAPGSGVGWRTLCTRRWADGACTNPQEWGFGKQGDAPLCRPCEKAAASAGRTPTVAEQGPTKRQRALTEAWQAVHAAVTPLGGYSPWNDGFTTARDKALNAILGLRDEAGNARSESS